MPIKRLTVLAALVSVLLLSDPLHADPVQVKASAAVDSPAVGTIAPKLLNQMPVFNAGLLLAQSTVPTYAELMAAADSSEVAATVVAVDSHAIQAGKDAQSSVDVDLSSITDVRKALVGLAMSLRDIRYVRGGRDPSTGFDCSGFVRYVFAHAIGMQLPTNSASQFLAGLKVKRADMKAGDLVFFHTRGKRNISHVGIYISDGHFIHSPASGKSVEISSLDEAYWAKHFAGAKRPEAIASVAHNG
jgi:cell wall-associated NlpC family hydrolase